MCSNHLPSQTQELVTGFYVYTAHLYKSPFCIRYFIWPSQRPCEVDRENIIRFTLRMKLRLRGYVTFPVTKHLVRSREEASLIFRSRSLLSHWQYHLTSNIFTTSFSFLIVDSGFYRLQKRPDSKLIVPSLCFSTDENYGPCTYIILEGTVSLTPI